MTPVVAPSVAAGNAEVEGDKKTDDIAVAMGKLEIEKGKGRESVEKDGVKET